MASLVLRITRDSTLVIDPSHKSQNASVPYPTMHHFVTEMFTHVHISVTKCCIVGYGTDAFWDLWDGSILSCSIHWWNFFFISAAEIECGEEALIRAASVIKKAYQDTDADVDIDDIVDIDCSFDGTWQKRGFTSLYGVGVVMDVLTGLVVDYEVLSLYCHTCVVNKARKPPEEFRLWKQGHEARG